MLAGMSRSVNHGDGLTPKGESESNHTPETLADAMLEVAFGVVARLSEEEHRLLMEGGILKPGSDPEGDAARERDWQAR